MTEFTYYPDGQLPTHDAFAAYLSCGDYELLPGSPESFDAVAAMISPPAGPAVIAIDGPTNSGKSTLAQALSDQLTARGVAVSRLPLDYFLLNREARNHVFEAVASGDLAISDYSQAGWNQTAYHTFLVSAKEALALPPGEARTLLIPNAYDRVTGRTEHAQFVPVYPGGVIITEGVGLHAYHSDLFDTLVRTDVRQQSVLLGRVLSREVLKPADQRLDGTYLTGRYQAVDKPHTQHLRTITSGKANFVVDATNFGTMSVYRKVG